jgi:hypothetical protein
VVSSQSINGLEVWDPIGNWASGEPSEERASTDLPVPTVSHFVITLLIIRTSFIIADAVLIIVWSSVDYGCHY